MRAPKPKFLSIGKRLVELREGRNLNQIQAAAALGIKYPTYQNYEYGFSQPNTDNLKKIIDYYGCSYRGLLDGEGDLYPKAGSTDTSAGPTHIKKEQAAWNAGGAAQKINIDDAMGKTYKVLSSGTPYAVALYLNIQQFSGALDATKELKVCQDSIADLHAQVDALRREVDALTAPPASLDQRADSSEKEAM